MNYGYIYKTTDQRNGKIYIGQNKGLFNKDYFGSGLIIKRIIKKNTVSSFKVELIAYLPEKQQLDEFERFLISKYREIIGREKMYNLADGGHGCSVDKGQKRTHAIDCKCPFCKSKRGELKGFKIGKKLNHKSNCACFICRAKRKEFVGGKNPNFGNSYNKESRDKIRNSRIGKPLNHKELCQCGVCKSKRGEYKKSTHPSWKGLKI